MNPLSTIKGTIISGVVLAIVIALIVAVLAKTGIGFNTPSFIMWLHVLAGVTWIGMLYYFNFVQVPALAAAAKDQGGPGGAGISKYVAPRALVWFRWGAVFTWLTGAGYLGHIGLLGDAFTLGLGPNGTLLGTYIGVGAWLTCNHEVADGSPGSPARRQPEHPRDRDRQDAAGPAAGDAHR